MQPNPGMRPMPYNDPAIQMREPMSNPGADVRLSSNNSQELEKISPWILMFRDPNRKYDCFKELNNQRDNIPQLAPLLWYSTGTVTILLQEIINIYPNLSPPTLT